MTFSLLDRQRISFLQRSSRGSRVPVVWTAAWSAIRTYQCTGYPAKRSPASSSGARSTIQQACSPAGLWAALTRLCVLVMLSVLALERTTAVVIQIGIYAGRQQPLGTFGVYVETPSFRSTLYNYGRMAGRLLLALLLARPRPQSYPTTAASFALAVAFMSVSYLFRILRRRKLIRWGCSFSL